MPTNYKNKDKDVIRKLEQSLLSLNIHLKIAIDYPCIISRKKLNKTLMFNLTKPKKS